MIDREKVLRALGICTQVEPVDECPHGCPYKFENGCIRGVRKDALELLKEQEPRVLSLSELEDTLETDTIVWLELRSNKMRQGHALVMSYSHAYGIMHIDTPFGDGPSQKIFNYAEYDTTWRCWSVKPTIEQRVKEKWGC